MTLHYIGFPVYFDHRWGLRVPAWLIVGTLLPSRHTNVWLQQWIPIL